MQSNSNMKRDIESDGLNILKRFNDSAKSNKSLSFSNKENNTNNTNTTFDSGINVDEECNDHNTSNALLKTYMDNQLELNESELKYYEEMIDTLANELESSKAVKDELLISLTNANDMSSKYEQMIKELSSENDNFNKNIQLLNDSITSLNKQHATSRESYNRMLQDKEKRIEMLDTQIIKEVNKNKDLLIQLDDLNKYISDTATANTIAAKDDDKSVIKVYMENQLDLQKTELQYYEDIVAELASKLEEMEALQQQWNDDKCILNDKILELDNTLIQQMSKVDDAEYKVSAYESLIQSKDEEIALAENALKEIQLQMSLKIQESKSRYSSPKTSTSTASMSTSVTPIAISSSSTSPFTTYIPASEDAVALATTPLYERISQLESLIEEKDGNINGQVYQLQSLQDSLSEYKSNSTVLKQQKKALKDMVEALKTRLEDVTEQLSKHTEEDVTHKSSMKALAAELHTYKATFSMKIQSLEEALEGSEVKIAHLTDLNDKHIHTVDALTSSHSELNHIMSMKEYEIAAEKELAAKASVDAYAQVAGYKTIIRELNSTLASRCSEISALTSELSDVTATRSMLEVKLDNKSIDEQNMYTSIATVTKAIQQYQSTFAVHKDTLMCAVSDLLLPMQSKIDTITAAVKHTTQRIESTRICVSVDDTSTAIASTPEKALVTDAYDDAVTTGTYQSIDELLLFGDASASASPYTPDSHTPAMAITTNDTVITASANRMSLLEDEVSQLNALIVQLQTDKAQLTSDVNDAYEYRYQCEHLQAKLSAASHTEQQLEDLIKSQDMELKRMEMALLSSYKQVQSQEHTKVTVYEQEIEKLMHDYEYVKNQCMQLTSELQTVKDSSTVLEDMKSSSDSEVKRLKQKLTATQEALHVEGIELKAVQAKLLEMTNEHVSVGNSLHKATNKIQLLQEELEMKSKHWHVQKAQLDMDNYDMKSIINSNYDAITTLKAELKELESANTLLVDAVTTARSDADSRSNELELLKSQLFTDDNQIHRLTASNELQDNRIQHLLGDVSRVTDDYTQLKEAHHLQSVKLIEAEVGYKETLGLLHIMRDELACVSSDSLSRKAAIELHDASMTAMQQELYELRSRCEAYGNDNVYLHTKLDGASVQDDVAANQIKMLHDTIHRYNDKINAIVCDMKALTDTVVVSTRHPLTPVKPVTAAAASNSNSGYFDSPVPVRFDHTSNGGDDENDSISGSTTGSVDDSILGAFNDTYATLKSKTEMLNRQNDALCKLIDNTRADEAIACKHQTVEESKDIVIDQCKKHIKLLQQDIHQLKNSSVAQVEDAIDSGQALMTSLIKKIADGINRVNYATLTHNSNDTKALQYIKDLLRQPAALAAASPASESTIQALVVLKALHTATVKEAEKCIQSLCYLYEQSVSRYNNTSTGGSTSISKNASVIMRENENLTAYIGELERELAIASDNLSDMTQALREGEAMCVELGNKTTSLQSELDRLYRSNSSSSAASYMHECRAKDQEISILRQKQQLLELQVMNITEHSNNRKNELETSNQQLLLNNSSLEGMIRSLQHDRARYIEENNSLKANRNAIQYDAIACRSIEYEDRQDKLEGEINRPRGPSAVTYMHAVTKDQIKGVVGVIRELVNVIRSEASAHGQDIPTPVAAYKGSSDRHRHKDNIGLNDLCSSLDTLRDAALWLRSNAAKAIVTKATANSTSDDKRVKALENEVVYYRTKAHPVPVADTNEYKALHAELQASEHSCSKLSSLVDRLEKQLRQKSSELTGSCIDDDGITTDIRINRYKGKIQVLEDIITVYRANAKGADATIAMEMEMQALRSGYNSEINLLEEEADTLRQHIKHRTNHMAEVYASLKRLSLPTASGSVNYNSDVAIQQLQSTLSVSEKQLHASYESIKSDRAKHVKEYQRIVDSLCVWMDTKKAVARYTDRLYDIVTNANDSSSSSSSTRAIATVNKIKRVLDNGTASCAHPSAASAGNSNTNVSWYDDTVRAVGGRNQYMNRASSAADKENNANGHASAVGTAGSRTFKMKTTSDGGARPSTASLRVFKASNSSVC